MQKLVFLLSVMSCFLMPASAVAAEAPTSSEAPSFARTYGHTFSLNTLGGDFISPVTTDAKYYFAGGCLLTTAALVFKQQLDEPVNDYLQEHQPLGLNSYGDQLGQLVPNLLYFGTQLGLYFYSHEAKPLRRSNLMFRATLHAGLATLIIKNIARHGRPYDNSVKTSFPSGHSSSSFAFASAVAMEHEWYWGLGAYALATYIGVSRINDHQHHLRDVLAGATLGISYGMGVYYRMQLESTTEGKDERVVTLLPSDDLSGANILYSQTF